VFRITKGYYQNFNLLCIIILDKTCASFFLVKNCTPLMCFHSLCLGIENFLNLYQCRILFYFKNILKFFLNITKVTMRNLQINNWIYDLFLVVIITYDLIYGLITLDKSLKILVAKNKYGTKLQW
jgi:hypothetical protein